MDGIPPHLPNEGFSNAAKDFVQGCLNKTPKLRPTYAMLLRHPWLAPLLKPPVISEEEDAESEDVAHPDGAASSSDDAEAAAEAKVIDKEVATWVRQAIENRNSGKLGKKAKPALHAAPLNVAPLTS